MLAKVIQLSTKGTGVIGAVSESDGGGLIFIGAPSIPLQTIVRIETSEEMPSRPGDTRPPLQVATGDVYKATPEEASKYVGRPSVVYHG